MTKAWADGTEPHPRLMKYKGQIWHEDDLWDFGADKFNKENPNYKGESFPDNFMYQIFLEAEPLTEEDIKKLKELKEREVVNKKHKKRKKKR